MGWCEGSQIQNCKFGVFALQKPLLKRNSKNILFYAIFLFEVTLRHYNIPNLLVQRDLIKYFNLAFLHKIDPY